MILTLRRVNRGIADDNKELSWQRDNNKNLGYRKSRKEIAKIKKKKRKKKKHRHNKNQNQQQQKDYIKIK